MPEVHQFGPLRDEVGVAPMVLSLQYIIHWCLLQSDVFSSRLEVLL